MPDFEYQNVITRGPIYFRRGSSNAIASSAELHEIVDWMKSRETPLQQSKPFVAVEVEPAFEEGGGNSDIAGTAWNLWYDVYLNICITNTGAPTTIKRAYISVREKNCEILRFSPRKVVKYLNRRSIDKSPELDKTLSGARIDTNGSWGPDIVLFTTQKIVHGEHPKLPEGDRFLIIEVVGQTVKVRI